MQRAGAVHDGLQRRALAVAHEAAACRVLPVVRDHRVAFPERVAVGEQIPSRLINRLGERKHGVHGEPRDEAGDGTGGVAHDHRVVAALREQRVEQREIHRRCAADVAAVGEQVRGVEQPAIIQRRGSARGHAEVRRLALVHRDAARLNLNRRRRPHHRPTGAEGHAVEPAAILPGCTGRVVREAPLHFMRAGRHRVSDLRPVHLAGNARLVGRVHHEAQPVVVLLRGNFPPERERAGSRDVGLDEGVSAVAHHAGLRGVLAVGGNCRLARPRARRAAEREGQCKVVQRLGDRDRQRERQRRIGTDHGAERVADEDGIISNQVRLHVRHGERGRGGAADAAAVRERQAVEAPAIRERRAADGGGVETSAAARADHAVRRLRGDDRRERADHNLIHPRAVESAGGAAVLHVLPAQRVAAGRDVEHTPLPVHFAGNILLLAAINEETQTVVHRLAGNFPPEAHGGQAGHGGLEPRGRAARERRTARGVNAVVRHRAVTDPGVRAVRGPRQARGVERERETEIGEDRERGDGTGRGAGRVADDDAVAARAGERHIGEHEIGTGHAAEAAAIHQRHAVVEPLIGEGRRAVGRDAEEGRRAEVHVLIHGLDRDARGLRAEGYFIEPRAILSARERGVLQIHPAAGLAAGAEEERFLFPIHLAGNARLLDAVDGEDQFVVVRFAGNFPPEAESARTNDDGLHHVRAVVGIGAGARGVGAVVRHDLLADPRRTGVRGPDETRAIEGGGERDERRHGQERARAGVEAGAVADHERVGAAVRDLRVGDREGGRVRTGDAGTVGHDRAIEEPGVCQRRRADGRAGEGDARSHFHVLPDRRRDDGRELRREGKLIHPAAILAGLAGSIFLIREPHGLTARAHEERALLPVRFAGDARLLEVVHEENERVAVRLAR